MGLYLESASIISLKRSLNTHTHTHLFLCKSAHCSYPLPSWHSFFSHPNCSYFISHICEQKLLCFCKRYPEIILHFVSVKFSHSVMSNSLQPHRLQYARLPCPSTTPRACLNSCPWVGGAIQPSHPLSSPSPSALNLSQLQGLFKWVSSSHQVAKVLEYSFSVSPSNEYSELISFRMEWLDLPAVQGTLKSVLQHHSSKASILLCSAFFIFQLSHPYMTTGKTIALTRWTFIGKVMSLLFNMLSRLLIVFLAMNKHLLISWL